METTCKSRPVAGQEYIQKETAKKAIQQFRIHVRDWPNLGKEIFRELAVFRTVEIKSLLEIIYFPQEIKGMAGVIQDWLISDMKFGTQKSIRTKIHVRIK